MCLIAAEMLRLCGGSGRFQYMESLTLPRFKTRSLAVFGERAYTAIYFRHSAAPREIVVATTPYALW